MSKKNIRKLIVAIIILTALTGCRKGGVNTTPNESFRLEGFYDMWPYMERVLFLEGKIIANREESPIKEDSQSVSFMYKGKKHRAAILNGGDNLVGFWGPYIEIVMGLVNADFLLRLWKADKVPMESEK